LYIKLPIAGVGPLQLQKIAKIVANITNYLFVITNLIKFLYNMLEHMLTEQYWFYYDKEKTKFVFNIFGTFFFDLPTFCLIDSILIDIGFQYTTQELHSFGQNGLYIAEVNVYHLFY
jgi:TRAP-type mannitol/chloroaromatic compound transport system permease small subunit